MTSEPPGRAEAVRLWCLDCSGGQPSEVRKCTRSHCPLWGYRMQSAPYSQVTIEANRAALKATPGLPEGYADCFVGR